MNLTTREAELLLTMVDDKLQDTTAVIADLKPQQKLDTDTTLLRGFANELINIGVKLANRTANAPNGLTPYDNNLVPISIITGTRTKRGIK